VLKAVPRRAERRNPPPDRRSRPRPSSVRRAAPERRSRRRSGRTDCPRASPGGTRPRCRLHAARLRRASPGSDATVAIIREGSRAFERWTCIPNEGLPPGPPCARTRHRDRRRLHAALADLASSRSRRARHPDVE
jgi:hypothetical protein